MKNKDDIRLEELLKRACKDAAKDDVKRTFAYRQDKGIRPEQTTLSPSDRIIHGISVSAGVNHVQLNEMEDRFLRTFRENVK